jgi:hypothetical protein
MHIYAPLDVLPEFDRYVLRVKHPHAPARQRPDGHHGGLVHSLGALLSRHLLPPLVQLLTGGQQRGGGRCAIGRAAAVLDLITSSTSGRLDRDTADHHRPRGRPPAYPSAARRGGMSVSDAVLGIRWSGLLVCTRTFRYL